MTILSTIVWRLQRAFTLAHVFVYRATSGKIGGTLDGPPLLLLTTIGRKTGKRRTTPVAFLPKDGEYLIAASSSGRANNPTWYFNLVSNPDVTIEVKGQRIQAKALITTGDERDQLYGLLKAAYPPFARAEKWTTRIIPVIRLQPSTVPEQQNETART